jgi:hypothetical protein
MPVDEKEVHPLTVGSERYDACREKVRRGGYWAPNRIYVDGCAYAKELVFVVDLMSQGCRYDRSLSDQKCEGCGQRGEGEKYSAMMIERAK